MAHVAVIHMAVVHAGVVGVVHSEIITDSFVSELEYSMLYVACFDVAYVVKCGQATPDDNMLNV